MLDDGWKLGFRIDLVSAGHLQSEEGCNDQRTAAVAFDNGFDCYCS